MQNKNEVIIADLQDRLETFIATLMNREFPSQYQDNEGANFAFRITAMDNIYQLSTQYAQVEPGGFVIYMTACFMSEDIEKDGIRILGVPLGRMVTKEFAVQEVETVDQLYNTIYQLMTDNHVGFVQALLD